MGGDGFIIFYYYLKFFFVVLFILSVCLVSFWFLFLFFACS